MVAGRAGSGPGDGHVSRGEVGGDHAFGGQHARHQLGAGAAALAQGGQECFDVGLGAEFGGDVEVGEQRRQVAQLAVEMSERILRAELSDAKAQAVPEGFVLVPKENISCYWQDNDEPENFCSNESDFDCLGDCIDLGEIMEINKFTQAHVNKEILFGTWFAEAIDPSEKANFFVGTHAECLEIVAKNKAMIEAQEQAND